MAGMHSAIGHGSLRQGGKEEVRAYVLKTYLLRIRDERGERAVRQVLVSAGIDPSIVENETGWVSTAAAKRALRAIVGQLGADSLSHRGTWATHPEALGTMVRMLRTAEQPIDAYRYLANHAREVTRVGTWEIAEIGAADAPKEIVRELRMTYRPRTDGDDPSDEFDVEGERMLCDARAGELASYPRIWGLPEARVTIEQSLAEGHDASVYHVRWNPMRRRYGAALGAAGAAVLSGSAIALSGGWLAGGIAFLLAGVLGGAVGLLWDRSVSEGTIRKFEQNRIAALERGLELRGETSATPSELTGTVLGAKYRIGRKIGSGGIGVVYAAEHLTLGHEVAVKVLRGAAARDGGEIARLRREAYIQVHVEHPNVVRVLDLDQMSDGSIYVVMERLIGRSLADKLSKEGLIAPGFAIPVFVDVARALGAAHRKGVVHRDLKPGNVYLCEDGTSKVLDFGMSKLASAESLTQTGYTLGTPEYMAPEQCIGANVEPRTDIYAFGVLMYEALTGELPISSTNRRDLLDLHQRQVPVPMRAKRPDLPIPAELDEIVLKCLKKKVGERPRTAQDLEAELATISLEGLPMSYGPEVRRRPVKRGSSTDPDAHTVPGMPAGSPPPPQGAPPAQGSV